MTPVVAVDDPTAVTRSAVVLRSGRTLVLPTDTVYGIAALAGDQSAVGDLFTRKQRGEKRSVAVLVASTAQARELAAGLDDRFDRLARRWWPGGLTLVVRRRDGLDYWLGDDADTIGVRCPDHWFVRALAAEVGPLATTSANLHGEPTPTTLHGVLDALGEVSLAIDGGELAGEASTVVDLTAPETTSVLRRGAIDPLATLGD